MNNQLLFGIASVPAIVGLVQVAKTSGMPARWSPILAVLLGIASTIAQVLAARFPIVPAIVVGISLGLSAAGIYSGTKAIVSPTTTAVDERTNERPAAVPPKA